MAKTKARRTGGKKESHRGKEKDAAARSGSKAVTSAAKKQELENRLRNAEWILARMKAGQLPIYTVDLETDPFKKDRVPVPFVAGLYDGLVFRSFWSDRNGSCIEKLRHFLEDRGVEPGIVYAHNGGRFDFFYLLDFFEGRTLIINSRIVSARMMLGREDNGDDYSNKGRRKKGIGKTSFEFRDSFAIMPFPLKAYQKDSLPLEYLTREQRGEHKGEIESYLKGDCVYLWDLVMQFQQEFGDCKTIASAAFGELGKFHKYDTLPLNQDEEIRSKFYYGGRVQCFKKGVIDSAIAIYDVNSMYPFVMDTFCHPVSWVSLEDDKLHGWNADGSFTKDKFKTFFLTVEGENRGAFPIRMPDKSVSFESLAGIYHVTVHEYLAAMQLKLFTGRILRTYNFSDYSRFHLFVDHYYRAREKAKRENDKVHSLFYKYILNSAYGKFGLNPENYFNWEITREPKEPKGKLWQLDSIVQGKYYVWKQPSPMFWNVKNIATAASITGAARSVLLRAIAESKSVLYCDTDSIICENFSGGKIDDKKLGAWKLEGQGTQAAIAGKKMYAVFNDRGECIKQANKGVALTAGEIRQIAQGKEILTWRDAPTFKRDGTATFVERKVRMT